MNPKVDEFLLKSPKWQDEMTRLRRIVLACGLTEELKWGKPCYSYRNSNIVIIQGFKEFCALMFFKGVLLKDTHGILVRIGENAQAMRQIRFTGLHEIIELEPVLKAHIFEAVEVEKAGLKIPVQAKSELVFPEEFQQKLDEFPALKAAFEALTPGRKRLYHIHFSEPKQAKTRVARIEKCIPQILAGKGLNE